MQHAHPPRHPNLVFDHIAIAARSLKEGAEWVRDALGIEMTPGGAHPRMGTHNLLLSLGVDCFLEVIAVDPAATPPDRARWFGLDGFDGPPRIGAWVLGTRDIAGSLADAGALASPIVEMTRGDLTWHMSVREDGTLPLSGAVPKLIQWPEGPHVAATMEDRGCRFSSLIVSHPQAAKVTTWLDGNFDDPRISIENGRAGFLAQIDTPTGRRTLR